MIRRIFAATIFLLASSTCFGQTPVHGLVAGQSTRADVERVAGKPVAFYSQTLVEYHAHEFDPKTWDKNVAKVYVQYRKDSPIAERIEAFLIRPISRSDAFKNLDRSTAAAHQPNLPDQPTARGKNGEHLVEYFGAPYYVVFTYQGADVSSGVARVNRYSKELFESVVSSLSSNASSNMSSNDLSGTWSATYREPTSGYNFRFQMVLNRVAAATWKGPLDYICVDRSDSSFKTQATIRTTGPGRIRLTYDTPRNGVQQTDGTYTNSQMNFGGPTGVTYTRK